MLLLHSLGGRLLLAVSSVFAQPVRFRDLGLFSSVSRSVHFQRRWICERAASPESLSCPLPSSLLETAGFPSFDTFFYPGHLSTEHERVTLSALSHLHPTAVTDRPNYRDPFCRRRRLCHSSGREPTLIEKLKKKYNVPAGAGAAAPGAAAAASPFSTPSKPAGAGVFGSGATPGPSPFGAGAGFGAAKPSPFGGGGGGSGFGQVRDVTAVVRGMAWVWVWAVFGECLARECRCRSRRLFRFPEFSLSVALDSRWDGLDFAVCFAE